MGVLSSAIQVIDSHEKTIALPAQRPEHHAARVRDERELGVKATRLPSWGEKDV
jgi:hypothetical protein